MARAKAPCGTYSAYKRHKRDGEPVDAECRRASLDRSRAEQAKHRGDDTRPPRAPRVETPEQRKSREEALRWNLALVESAMVEVDAGRLAALSKRHSELLDELDKLTGADKKEDPFDAFFSAGSNVIGFPTAKDREAS